MKATASAAEMSSLKVLRSDFGSQKFYMPDYEEREKHFSWKNS
jgi:hypothetical protein